MAFAVDFHDAFLPEFRVLDRVVRVAVAKCIEALEVEGPQLGRPWVDTLKGSAHPNMKELRVTANKAEWRVAFAFDPVRHAVLLAAAVKGGRKDARVCAELTRVADARFAAHVAAFKITKGN